MGAVQAPDGLQTISINGQLYNVDSEAINSLKQRGIAYDDGSNWNKPEAGSVNETLHDFGRGVVHGGTFGLADKQFGDSNQSVMQRLGGDDYAAVEKRSPIAAPVGDFAATVAMPVPGLAEASGAKGALGLLARAGEQAAVGSGDAALRAYSDNKDVGTAAAIGGMLGSVGSVAGEGAAGLAAGATKYGSKIANKIADTARTIPYAIGGSDKQLAKIAERFGVEQLPSKIAAAIEELVPSEGRVLGRNRQEQYNELQNVLGEEGPRLGDMRAVAGQEAAQAAGMPERDLVTGKWSDVLQALEAKLGGMSQRTDADRKLAGAFSKDIEAFKSEPSPLDVSELAGLKSAYQEAGHTGKLGTVEDKAAGQSAALIGQEAKGALDDILSSASPETAAEHAFSNDRYSKAAMLSDQISPKAIREALGSLAPQLGSIALGTLGGAATGAMGGIAAGSPVAAIGGALTGAGTGFMATTNTGTRNLMSQLLASPRAMDTLANVARASGKSLKDLDLNKLRQIIQAQTGKFAGYAGE